MILKNDIKSKLRLSIPSDGALYVPTMDFLSSCGLKVERTNERQYTARLIEPCEATVIFQRATDDGFFISIESSDELYDDQNTIDFLSSIGGKDIEVVKK